MKLKIHKKDTVMVIAGKDRGKTGEVIRVYPGSGDKTARVMVSKVNVVTKHKKPKQSEPGGIQKTEAPIDISNVMLVCPKCKKTIRPKLDTMQSGDRVRVCRKCSEVIL